MLKADSYAAALEETEGIIAEFVNPKYKDDSRTAFKSSTRLECMMQDFPHGLPPTAAVGFTVVNQARIRLLRDRGRTGLHDNLQGIITVHTISNATIDTVCTDAQTSPGFVMKGTQAHVLQ